MANTLFTTAQLKETAVTIADSSGIDRDVILAICQVESAWNTWATRYEPGFYERYISGKGVKGVYPCSNHTEARCRATSFGLMQVMGAVARERGFKGVYLTELCSPTMGITYGCLHLKAFLNKFSSYRDAVAAYNGGAGAVKARGVYSNPEYVEKVENVLGRKLNE